MKRRAFLGLLGKCAITLVAAPSLATEAPAWAESLVRGLFQGLPLKRQRIVRLAVPNVPPRWVPDPMAAMQPRPHMTWIDVPVTQTSEDGGRTWQAYVDARTGAFVA